MMIYIYIYIYIYSVASYIVLLSSSPHHVGELDSVCRIKEVVGEVALNFKAACARFLTKNGHKFEKK